MLEMESRFGGGHFCRVVVVLDDADVSIRGFFLYLLLYNALCALVLVIQAISLSASGCCQITATDMLVTHGYMTGKGYG